MNQNNIQNSDKNMPSLSLWSLKV